jgi:hypothetical protein
VTRRNQVARYQTPQIRRSSTLPGSRSPGGEDDLLEPDFRTGGVHLGLRMLYVRVAYSVGDLRRLGVNVADGSSVLLRVGGEVAVRLKVNLLNELFGSLARAFAG